MSLESGVHERDVDRNEARESNFVMSTELPKMRHDDPLMGAYIARWGLEDCPDCGARCATCDERVCLQYGPAPVRVDDAILCERCAS